MSKPTVEFNIEGDSLVARVVSTSGLEGTFKGIIRNTALEHVKEFIAYVEGFSTKSEADFSSVPTSPQTSV